MKLKVAARLLLLFTAAGLVPLAVTLLVVVPRGQDALRTSARLLHQSEIEALGARVDGALDDLVADVRLLAASGHDDSERRALVRFLVEKHPELTAATLYASGAKVAGGQAYDRAQISPTELEEHERRAQLLLAGGQLGQALRDGGLAASDFYVSDRRREILVTLLTPLGNGRALAVEMSLGRVQELIAHAHVGRRGTAFIVDGAGKLLAHPELERALLRQDRSAVPIVAELLPNIGAGNGRILVSEFVSDGQAQVGAFASLGWLRWGLVVAEPREDAYGLARATWAHAAGWTALALALALVAAYFFARGITRPVAQLVTGTRGLADGAFGLSVPVEGPPEIAELARTFNDASQRLDQYDADNRRLLLAVERGYLEVLRALVNAIEAKDPYTAGHSQRTADYAVAIGQKLGLSEDDLKELEVGGLLHDIGKIGIAEQILRKPAQLDDAEMRVMRGHPAIGDGIVSDIEMLSRIRSMVRNHHERFDGSGYPDGLRGEGIPLGARIIAVADTYDAITSDRCYQPGRPPMETVPILRRLSGVQLDAAVVDALFEALVELGQLSAADLDLPATTAQAALPPRRRPTLDIVISRKRSDMN